MNSKTPLNFSLIKIPKKVIPILKERGFNFVEDLDFNAYCRISGFIGIGKVTLKIINKIVEQNNKVKAKNFKPFQTQINFQ